MIDWSISGVQCGVGAFISQVRCQVLGADQPFSPSSLREHVCVLQPAVGRQTGTDVHGGPCSQRCPGSRLKHAWTADQSPFPILYSLLLPLDCSKTFRVTLGQSQLTATQLHPVFIPTGHTHTHTHTLTQLQCLWWVTLMLLCAGYYILVYLQGHFLHCVNTRQQEMLCYSLFLSGKLFFWGGDTHLWNLSEFS